MDGKGAKNKGSQFEREVAKLLSVWVSGCSGYTKDQERYIERRSGSGGIRADLEGKSGHGGDLISVHECSKGLFDNVVFELKSYKNLEREWWKFTIGDGSKVINEFIKQSEDGAKVYNRFYMLILKTRYLNPVCITDCRELVESIYGGVAMDVGKVGYFSLDRLLKSDYFDLLESIQDARANKLKD